MRIRRLLAIVVASLLVFAACSDDKKTTTSSGSSASNNAGGGAQTVPVAVDAETSTTNPVGFIAYFPSEVTIHPGDSIEFNSHFNGEPHTVTFSTLLDQGLPKADPNAQDEPAEIKKLPGLLPQGPGDAVQAAAQPCYLESGDPPQTDACTTDQQKPVDFNGKQTYYNSGFLADGDTFKVTLAKDIAPGTYNYFCLLHREGMLGKVTVVAADQTAQSGDEVKQAGEKAVSDQQDKLRPTIDAIATGALPPFIPTASPGGVIAGGGSQDAEEAYPVLFGPDKVDVKVGGTVTWTIVGPHTITFGSSEASRTFMTKSPDGSVHINPDTFTPAGGAGMPDQDPNAPPPADGTPPTPIDGGSYDGTGLHSSGLVDSFPPALFTYSMTFTKAGSFSYVCLIHADMKGTVNVT